MLLAEWQAYSRVTTNSDIIVTLARARLSSRRLELQNSRVS